ncbi:MAG: helicase-related protein, partial [Eubacteriales bacterium]|nr:helicase-related protein [Eubacteriales bacterium]
VPSVVWNRRRNGFVCPYCNTVQEMDVFEDGSRYTVNADSLFYIRENSKNHKCQNPECETPLWSALNPDVHDPAKTPWVRIGEYGYVHRQFAFRNLSLVKEEGLRGKIAEVVKNPNGIFPAAAALRKYPLAKYIKRRIRRVDALIADELHEYSGESAQGEAMADLAGISKKVLGLTATLINGYSKGMFYLLYRLKPHLMQLDQKHFSLPREFCEEYGVVQRTYHVDSGGDYNAKSKAKKRKVREKFLPGVSPLVYSRFLLENAVFLSLSDMGKELPEYEELPLPCKQTVEVMKQYSGMEEALRKILKTDRKIANRILSGYMNLLSTYPDQPYNQKPILHPLSKDPLVIPKDMGSMDVMYQKDERILALVKRKVSGGERVIVYTAWTRLDTRKKLHKLLTENGFRTAILDVNVPPAKREDWVDEKVRDGIDVLLVNPTLVQTGLDLIAFTTLVFYNTSYSLYVLRQASRRSWRINQTAPRVEVYLMYYENTMQQRALRLMASKLTAATVIEGNVSDEGLAAMSDCEDLTTQLAKELALGIRDDVDNLADSFKKMAILREPEAQPPMAAPAQVLPSLQPVPVQTPTAVQTVVSVPVMSAPVIRPADSDDWNRLALQVLMSARKSRKPKQSGTDTGQLSLLDLFAS